MAEPTGNENEEQALRYVQHRRSQHLAENKAEKLAKAQRNARLPMLAKLMQGRASEALKKALWHQAKADTMDANWRHEQER